MRRVWRRWRRDVWDGRVAREWRGRSGRCRCKRRRRRRREAEGHVQAMLLADAGRALRIVQAVPVLRFAVSEAEPATSLLPLATQSALGAVIHVLVVTNFVVFHLTQGGIALPLRNSVLVHEFPLPSRRYLHLCREVLRKNARGGILHGACRRSKAEREEEAKTSQPSPTCCVFFFEEFNSNPVLSPALGGLRRAATKTRSRARVTPSPKRSGAINERKMPPASTTNGGHFRRPTQRGFLGRNGVARVVDCCETRSLDWTLSKLCIVLTCGSEGAYDHRRDPPQLGGSSRARG